MKRWKPLKLVYVCFGSATRLCSDVAVLVLNTIPMCVMTYSLLRMGSPLTPQTIHAHPQATRAFSAGVAFGFPMEDVAVTLTSLQRAHDTPTHLLRSAVQQAVLKAARTACGIDHHQHDSALQHESMALLEPLMRVEVETEEEYLGAVVSDLTGSRRGHVIDVRIAYCLVCFHACDVVAFRSFKSSVDATAFLALHVSPKLLLVLSVLRVPSSPGGSRGGLSSSQGEGRRTIAHSHRLQYTLALQNTRTRRLYHGVSTVRRPVVTGGAEGDPRCGGTVMMMVARIMRRALCPKRMA